MTVSNADYLKGQYNAVRLLGNKSVNSDAFFEIDGYPQIGFLIKQFPWPTLGPGGEIEVAGPAGMGMWQPQQLKIHQEGQITLMETITGSVQAFLEDVITRSGAIFQGTVYEGTPDRFYRAHPMRDCFFQPENPDRDWENRAQITTISGSLKFHFFGEKIPGNILPV